MAEQTISSEQLCALTGLTDRRHRQLAKSGYFPPPLNGQYQSGPTVRGLFKYYREQLDKKDDTLQQEKKKYMKARREKAEVETSILKRDYIPSAEVETVMRNFMLHQKAVLQLKLEIEEPPKLVGLPVVEIGQRMKVTVNEICRIHREGVSKWMKEAPPKSA